jgi:hypothetical protein
MRTTLGQQKFFNSEEAVRVRESLQSMVDDPCFNTQLPYTANPESTRSFVDKHMTYLSLHPKVNPQHYLSNLRLMTRIAPSPVVK